MQNNQTGASILVRNPGASGRARKAWRAPRVAARGSAGAWLARVVFVVAELLSQNMAVTNSSRRACAAAFFMGCARMSGALNIRAQ